MFTEDLSTFFDTDEFGTPATVNGAPVNGIFEKKFVSVSSGNVLVEGFKPTFACASQDVFDANEGAPVVVDSVNYTVVFNQPDGTGESLLVLKRA